MKEDNQSHGLNINNKIISILKNPLIYILPFCAYICKIIYGFTNKYTTFPDTPSYINYSENIFNGEISASRTPVYPFFIKIIRKLYGEENLYNSIVFMQYVIFFISIIFFYLTIKKICNNKFFSSISTIIYGISPYVFLWNNTILTESLSISAITLLAYMTVSYLHKPNRFFCYFIGIYIFGLIMLRPAFIYVAAIYLIFWILRYFTNKNEKKNNIIGSISMFVCLMLVITYCLFIKIQHGNFEITYISSVNKIMCILESETYKSGNNENIINVINNEFKDGISREKMWNSAHKIVDTFEKKEIDEYCKSIYKNDTKKYMFYIAENVLTLGNMNIGTRYAQYRFDYSSTKYKFLDAYEKSIFPVNFIHIYILIFGSIVFLLILLLKTKKMPWMYAFLIGMISGNLFVIIIGSPGEYQRLFSASMPLTIILITYIIYLIFINLNYKELENKMIKLK